MQTSKVTALNFQGKLTLNGCTQCCGLWLSQTVDYYKYTCIPYRSVCEKGGGGGGKREREREKGEFFSKVPQ